MTRLVLISDTHNNPPSPDDLPAGDVLVHCGDATARGSEAEFNNFGKWLGRVGFSDIVLTYGNHDWLGEMSPRWAEELLQQAARRELHILVDSGAVVQGHKFWGSPWQPEFHNWAFNLPLGCAQLKQKWGLIPEDTDVLVTHGPPAGILDRCADGFEAGCVDLANRVSEVKPKLHVFGHIHEGHGRAHRGGTEYVNASYLDRNYRVPIHNVQTFDLTD